MMPDKSWFHSGSVSLPSPGIFFFFFGSRLTFLVQLLEEPADVHWTVDQLLFFLSLLLVYIQHTGNVQAQLSFSWNFRQFQVDGNDCLSVSSSPVPRPHQYLPGSFLPVRVQFSITPCSSLSQLNSSSSLHRVFKHPPSLSLLFLAKGAKYFEMCLHVI